MSKSETAKELKKGIKKMKYVVRFNEVGHKYPKFECRHVEADSKEEAIKKA